VASPWEVAVAEPVTQNTARADRGLAGPSRLPTGLYDGSDPRYGYYRKIRLRDL